MPKKRWPKDDLDDTEAYLTALGNSLDLPGDRLGASQWRDDIDREPLDTIADNTLRGIHPPSAGMAPTTGGAAVSDSIADRARQVMTMAEKAPAAQIEQLQQAVNEWNAEVQGLLGEGASGAMFINQVTQQVLQTCADLLQAIDLMKQAAQDTGQRHLDG